MVRGTCKLLGAIFLVVVVAGFLKSDLLGMHLSTWHNVVHLVSGALALAFGFGRSENAAITFCRVFGTVYFLLGIVGFIAPDTVHALLRAGESAAGASLAADNAVHIAFGLAFLVPGLARARQPTSTTPTTPRAA